MLAESKYVFMKRFIEISGYLEKLGLGNAIISILDTSESDNPKVTDVGFAKIITATVNKNNVNLGNDWYNVLIAKFQIIGGKAVVLGAGGINGRYGGNSVSMYICNPKYTSYSKTMVAFPPCEPNVFNSPSPFAKILDEGTYIAIIGVRGSNVNILQARATLVIANVSESLISKVNKWSVKPTEPTAPYPPCVETSPYGACFAQMEYAGRLGVRIRGPFLGFVAPYNNSPSPAGRLSVKYGNEDVFGSEVVEDTVNPTHTIALATDENDLTVTVEQGGANQSLCVFNLLAMLTKI